MDKELAKSELAMYGVLLEGDKCVVIENGERSTVPADEEYHRLASAVDEKKALLKELWVEVVRNCMSPTAAINAGSDRTGRMFIDAIKHLYTLSVKRKMPAQQYFKRLLARDINSFSESFMSKIVDLKIGIDWVTHLVYADKYRMRILRALAKVHPNEKEASVSGPWANLDLPMQERVWSYHDEGENLEGRDLENQKQQRYQLPDSYNDPYDFEEGFYYREERNEPYAWGDEENNPYPHRNQLWDD